MAFISERDTQPPSADDGAAVRSKEDAYWLDLASQAYQASTSYIDTNYRAKWDDAIRHFRSQHASGSKYNKASYQYRSKLFRPKTRSMSRNYEAALAAAFFSNADLINIEPADKDNPVQAASAAITYEILQHHLTKSIPWFVTCLGAGQESHRVGCVFSYQNWQYEERPFKFEVPAVDEMGQPIIGDDGKPTTTTVEESKVLRDCPMVELLPPENVRFHPAAKWYDPIGTSPYLQILWPMYVRDVKARMTEPDENQKVPKRKWKKLDDKDIAGAMRLVNDRTKQTRSGNMEDPADKPIGSVKQFDVVWCIENFFNVDGADVVYWTLGTEHMLADPVPIEEDYWTGERPVVMGVAAIETFITMPDGPVGHTAPLNQEINEVVNQRMDNVSLAMNKRWLMKQGSNIDLRSLLANVPGGVTQVPDLDGFLKPVEFTDVTASAFQEQDRLSVEFDELGGSFSQSSVATNRKLNETVGGMNMLRGSAGEVRELTIRTFSETWVERVMRQLVKLIQKYESNLSVIALAGQRANVFQRYGIDQITDDMLTQELTTSVNVGQGATDPMGKLQKFILALESFMKVATLQAKMPQPILKLEPIGNEIFGRIGLKSGSRFLVTEEDQGGQIDPAQVQQLVMQNQQLMQAVQELQMQLKDKSEDRQLKLITAQMSERGQTERKAAELETRLVEKTADLMNPVAGERKPQRPKEAGKAKAA